MTQHVADPGATLAARLAHPSPMTPLEVALVGHQLATTLDVWHRAGHLHRGVEPAAVDLATDPAGRLVARLRPPQDTTAVGPTGPADPAVSRYRAPEQLTGRPVGPAADVYGLGVVLLDALTARRDRPPAVPDDIGSAWRYLLAGMIAGSPTDRPTAATVVRALGQVPGVVPATPEPPVTTTATPAPRSKLLPGGAHVVPAPVEVPRPNRLARLLPPVPGLRRASREPDVRHHPEPPL